MLAWRLNVRDCCTPNMQACRAIGMVSKADRHVLLRIHFDWIKLDKLVHSPRSVKKGVIITPFRAVLSGCIARSHFRQNNECHVVRFQQAL